MRAIIVRHAEALERAQDPERGLSPRGREQAERLGRKLAGLAIAPARIVHSNKARARQTAEAIAAALPAAPAPRVRAGLAPDDPVEPLVRELLAAEDDWLIVGHLPFVGYLTAVLTTHAGPGLPAFEPSGCAVLQKDEATGAWTIEHVLSGQD